MSKTMVSTQMPYHVWSVGEDFERLFEYPITEMIGNSMLKLTGPRTDLMLLCTSIESHCRLHKKDMIDIFCILYSRTGQELKLSISLESHLEHGNSYCLVGFKEAGNTCKDCKQRHSSSNLNSKLCPVLVKQRSSFEESPLIITPALIQSLRGVSLPLAAQAVGISTYALKLACRRLGIPRWPYSRGPNRCKRHIATGSQLERLRLDPGIDAVATTQTEENSTENASFADISEDFNLNRISTLCSSRRLADCVLDCDESWGAAGAEQNPSVNDCPTPSEWLADGCRALEEEWAGVCAAVEEAEGSPGGSAAQADDRLVLDMLAQPWR